MQRVLAGVNPDQGPNFVAAYIDDLLVFSSSLQTHLDHLNRVMKRIREVGLKVNPSKCQFIRNEVEYLGHVITPEGLRPNDKLTTAIRDYTLPKNVRELKRFLGLASYYRRFVHQFSKVAQPLHRLTCKDTEFRWSDECQSAFERLKELLVTSPILAYPNFQRDFILETDASLQGLGAVLSQVQPDNRSHPIAYASRELTPAEKNYGITDLETLAVVWSISHFHYYLYGHRVTVYTDHSAVKSVLETSSPSGRHARWWTRVYGQGIKEVNIVFRAGKEKVAADALSRNPLPNVPSEGLAESETQVATISSLPRSTMQEVLQSDPVDEGTPDELLEAQRKDPEVLEMLNYLEHGELPANDKDARRTVMQSSTYCLIDKVLYYVDSHRGNIRRIVVPRSLRDRILSENHSGPCAGHFAGHKLYNVLVRYWYWKGMYNDTMNFCRSCPECVTVLGSGKLVKPPLCPIPIQRPFQILGVDVMDLPITEKGNKHVVVFQDYFTKWPLVYPVPDQKATRLVELLTKEVIPFFGVPEALLSDRGTNLLSNLMKDVCSALGITKLNTTAYHPQCDGMVERFNRTLKAMLRKHAGRYGNQWDQYLARILWAYRNTPHETTGEKPSFLLFGMDCRSPTDAELSPPSNQSETDVAAFRAELMESLSFARSLAAETIRQAQMKYKVQYDRKAKPDQYRIGEWVLIKFPSEESGKQRKLSRPWHGPYRVMSLTDADITAIKIYFPEDGSIKVHQSRVSPCPVSFPAGYYWYGGRKQGPGHPPKWLERIFQNRDEKLEVRKETDIQYDKPVEQDVAGTDEPEVTQPQLVPKKRTRTREIQLPARFSNHLGEADN